MGNDVTSIGLTIALVVDVVAPLALLLVVGARNVRTHTSRKTEFQFWLIVAGCQVLLVVGIVGAMLNSIPAYVGSSVVLDAIMALPLSIIPALVNSSTMHIFYTDQEWADFGYLTVVPIFTVGLLPWAVLNAVLLRRIIQYRRSRLKSVGPRASD